MWKRSRQSPVHIVFRTLAAAEQILMCSAEVRPRLGFMSNLTIAHDAVPVPAVSYATLLEVTIK